MENTIGEAFELPVQFKGHERLLPARLVRFGYSYRIYVQAGDAEILFEPDEERNFRAMVEDAVARDKIDVELIRAIVEALENNFR